MKTSSLTPVFRKIYDELYPLNPRSDETLSMRDYLLEDLEELLIKVYTKGAEDALFGAIR